MKEFSSEFDKSATIAEPKLLLLQYLTLLCTNVLFSMIQAYGLSIFI